MRYEDCLAFRVDYSRALSALPDRQRAVFALVTGDGLTATDAARELGLHPRTASRAHQAALTALRHSLRAYAQTGPTP